MAASRRNWPPMKFESRHRRLSAEEKIEPVATMRASRGKSAPHYNKALDFTSFRRITNSSKQLKLKVKSLYFCALQSTLNGFTTKNTENDEKNRENEGQSTLRTQVATEYACE